MEKPYKIATGNTIKKNQNCQNLLIFRAFFEKVVVLEIGQIFKLGPKNQQIMKI